LFSIKDQGMNQKNIKFAKHACQFCGSENKFVETLIDDEFYWDEVTQMYQPSKFSDDFEHTGNERCVDCENVWSGF
jgi:hypothetical protein